LRQDGVTPRAQEEEPKRKPEAFAAGFLFVVIGQNYNSNKMKICGANQPLLLHYSLLLITFQKSRMRFLVKSEK
jgi:hypothetical protein